MNQYKFFMRFEKKNNKNYQTYHEDWYEAANEMYAYEAAEGYAWFMTLHDESLVCTEIKLIDVIKG